MEDEVEVVEGGGSVATGFATGVGWGKILQDLCKASLGGKKIAILHEKVAILQRSCFQRLKESLQILPSSRSLYRVATGFVGPEEDFFFLKQEEQILNEISQTKSL